MESSFETSIAILGDKGAGKTSLARRLIDVNAEMPEVGESTIGVTRYVWELDKQEDKCINVNICDCSGSTITHTAHHCFMHSHCLYIYVADGRRDCRDSVNYWLNHIKCSGSPIIILVNTRGADESFISNMAFPKIYHPTPNYFSMDIEKDTDKLLEFQTLVINTLHSNANSICVPMSRSIRIFKTALDNHFKDARKEHISLEAFQKIASNNSISKVDSKKALEGMVNLGYYFVERHYSENHVINTNWIAEGMYTLIHWGGHQQKYKITLDDAITAFKKANLASRFPKDEIKFLFKIMCKYELAFIEGEYTSNECIVIPLVLPISRHPDALTQKDFIFVEHLRMELEVERVMPSHIIPRLVVIQHRDSVPQQLWRKGAVLEYSKGDATSLVIENDRKIIIYVKGSDKSKYISELRQTLITIFNDYRRVKYDFYYETLTS